MNTKTIMPSVCRLHAGCSLQRVLFVAAEISVPAAHRRKCLIEVIRRKLYSLNGAWPVLDDGAEKPPTTDGSGLHHHASASNFYKQKKEIERIWAPRVQAQDRTEAETVQKYLHSSTTPRKSLDVKYVLSMFPYPSGRLHLGHVRVYTISDTIARYYRLRGKHVFHPMGWDAFGLPAENASIEHGVSAARWTMENIKQMETQLDAFNFSFDWQTAVRTCEPEYYKWTQLIFLKLFEAGLVYQKAAWLNWDPVDRTVLANEQIDSDGRSWRSGALVERRVMRQWFVRTTQYSQQLLAGLDEVEPKWRDEIVSVQRNWIGKCDGRKVRFDLNSVQVAGLKTTQLEVFTRKIEGTMGAAFLALKPSHVFVHELCDAGIIKRQDIEDALFLRKFEKPKTASSNVLPASSPPAGIFELPVRAINPLRGRSEIPVFVVASDSPLFSSPRPEDAKLDAHIGIPSLDQDDMLFVQTHGIPSRDILGFGGNKIVSSGEFSGLLLNEAREAIGAHLENMRYASGLTSAGLEDWLVSRQRFWGTPIPIIHCDACGEAVPVPEDQLPVELPPADDRTISKKTHVAGRSEAVASPLADYADFVRCSCPQCGSSNARRETDTLDTFFDSTWYFLRYPDCNNRNEPFNADIAHRIMPVDLYVGGREHAVMHLYFARFMSHFMHHKLKWLPRAEPFDHLLVQGFVMGKNYKGLKSGRYFKPDEVEEFHVRPSEVAQSSSDVARLVREQLQQRSGVTKTNRQQQEKSAAVETNQQEEAPVTLYRLRDGGELVLSQWEKMSKSRLNGTDPAQALDAYGIDSTRLYMLANISPRTHRSWDPNLFSGSLNFEKRLWRTVGLLLEHYQNNQNPMSNNNDVALDAEAVAGAAARLRDARNYYVRGVTYQLEHYFALSTAIGKLQGLLGDLRKENLTVATHTDEYERALGALIVMLYPFAPHYAAELWTGLCAARKDQQQPLFTGEVWQQTWPKLDADYGMPLTLQIFDEKLDTIRVPYAEFVSMTHDEALKRAYDGSEMLPKYIESHPSIFAEAEEKGGNITAVQGDGRVRQSQFIMQPDNEAILTFFDKEGLRKLQFDMKAAKRERKAQKEEKLRKAAGEQPRKEKSQMSA